MPGEPKTKKAACRGTGTKIMSSPEEDGDRTISQAKRVLSEVASVLSNPRYQLQGRYYEQNKAARSFFLFLKPTFLSWTELRLTGWHCFLHFLGRLDCYVEAKESPNRRRGFQINVILDDPIFPECAFKFLSFLFDGCWDCSLLPNYTPTANLQRQKCHQTRSASSRMC